MLEEQQKYYSHKNCKKNDCEHFCPTKHANTGRDEFARRHLFRSGFKSSVASNLCAESEDENASCYEADLTDPISADDCQNES